MGNSAILAQSEPHHTTACTITLEDIDRHNGHDTFPVRESWILRADKLDEAVPGRVLVSEGWTLTIEKLEKPVPRHSAM